MEILSENPSVDSSILSWPTSDNEGLQDVLQPLSFCKYNSVTAKGLWAILVTAIFKSSRYLEKIQQILHCNK
mgnify:CR=1 FL=1